MSTSPLSSPLSVELAPKRGRKMTETNKSTWQIQLNSSGTTAGEAAIVIEAKDWIWRIAIDFEEERLFSLHSERKTL
jgi:hypothetical protein